jgi:recombinational DNA repair ATPase RecF
MITSINIENFKAFKEADLSFANLTLLSGLNGMGKTTVIQSLLLLRQSYEKKTLPDKGLFLNGDYLTIGGGKDAYCRDGEGDYIRFELEWDDKFNTAFNFSYSPGSDLQPLKSHITTDSFDPFSTSLFNSNFPPYSLSHIGLSRGATSFAGH